MTRGPAAYGRRFAGFQHGGSIAIHPVMLLTLLVILLVVALLGGGVGYNRFGYAGWSPAGIVVVILLVMLLMGRL